LSGKENVEEGASMIQDSGIQSCLLSNGQYHAKFLDNGQAEVASLPSPPVAHQKPLYIEAHNKLLHNVNVMMNNIQPPPPVKTPWEWPRKPPNEPVRDEQKEEIPKLTATAMKLLPVAEFLPHPETTQDTPPVRVIHCHKARTMPPGKSVLGIIALSVHNGHLGMLLSSPVQLCLDLGADITLILEDCYNALEHWPKLQKGMKLNLFELTNQAKILGFINLWIFMPMAGNRVLEFIEEAYIIPGMNVPVSLGEDFQVNYKISVLRSVQGMYLLINQPGEQFDVVAHLTPPLTDSTSNPIIHQR
jgi:hypothetical protein